jgi:hypothetical protein
VGGAGGIALHYVREAFDAPISSRRHLRKLGGRRRPQGGHPRAGLFKDIHTTVAHHITTPSARLGASCNVPITARCCRCARAATRQLGTDNADTRLDFDTLEKWAITAGPAFASAASS